MRKASKKSSDVVPDLGRRVREMIATKVIRTTPIKSPNSTRGRQSRDREGSSVSRQGGVEVESEGYGVRQDVDSGG
jgi:hypothetical protein